jgi:hypothetical protein
MAILQPLMIPRVMASLTLTAPGSDQDQDRTWLSNPYVLALLFFGMRVVSALSVYTYEVS